MHSLQYLKYIIFEIQQLFSEVLSYYEPLDFIKEDHRNYCFNAQLFFPHKIFVLIQITGRLDFTLFYKITDHSFCCYFQVKGVDMGK